MRRALRADVFRAPTRALPRARRAALAVLLVAVAVSSAAAQTPRFTAEPSMTRGPADAPVTIVEFSDYQ